MKIYDRQGNEIDFDQYGRLFMDKDYKRVAVTEIGDGSAVSTVWLGMDHSFGMYHEWETDEQGNPTETPRPIIFETMIFGGEHDNYMRRYSTLREAQEGHDHLVWRLRRGLDPDEN